MRRARAPFLAGAFLAAVLHREGTPAFVPGWYPLLCTGFDPVVAVAALRGSRRRS